MEDRINKFIVNEHITPTKFADSIGVQRSAISHILSGRNKPSFDLIQKILQKYPRISAEWLLMGRGEMYKTTIQQKLFETDNKSIQTEIKKNEPEIPNIQINNVDETKAKSSENRINDKRIERIIIFYNDKSFKEYYPIE